MATAVVMPKLGNTVESSIIARWRKAKGEQVTQGEILCEVETDKAMMEVESPASGILLDVFFGEGDDVPVLTNIAVIGNRGEDTETLRPDNARVRQPITHPTPRSNGQAARVGGKAKPVTASSEAAPSISPRAGKLAKQKGLNPYSIEGTGPGGRIIERDVQAALMAKPRMTPLARSMVETGDFVAPPRASGAGRRVTTKDLLPADRADKPAQPIDDEAQVIPVKGVRKVIAERMLSSLQTTAQLTLNTSADARALLDYRKRLKNSVEASGLQDVTINHLVLFAVSRTLVQHPELNALYVENAIRQYHNVHLGFAVDTSRGLIVPVIHQANRLGLKQMADEADRLAEACQKGTVSPDKLEGSTFTVTNLGSLGIETFTPILNPPQVGILGVGNVHLKPVDIDGVIEFIPHLSLSLTVNHQVVDGAPAARFLQTLAKNLSLFEILLAL